MARPRLLTAAVIAVLVCGAAATACMGDDEPSADEQIQTLLEDPDRQSRRQAAEQLAETEDPAIVRRVLRQAQGKPAARPGVGLLRASLVTSYRTAPNDPETRMAAIRSLAAFDDPAAADAVADALLDDPNARVREASATALGQMLRSSPLVVRRLVIYREVPRPNARAVPQVERALAEIGLPAVRQLLRLGLVQELAWAQEIVARNATPAVRLLTAQLARGTFREQVEASYGLLALRKTQPGLVSRSIPTIVSKMMAKLGPSGFDASYVLARVGRPALTRLVPLARTPFQELQGVEKRQAQVVTFTLVTMAKVNPKATATLVSALRRGDHALIVDLHDFYIQLGRPGSEGALAAALDAEGDTLMALAFLNSGNRRLDQAARDWAARNGYTITTTSGTGPPPSWRSIDDVPTGP